MIWKALEVIDERLVNEYGGADSKTGSHRANDVLEWMMERWEYIGYDEEDGHTLDIVEGGFTTSMIYLRSRITTSRRELRQS